MDYTKAGGVLKFGFGRDVPPQNLEVDPYKYQFFKKRVTHTYTNLLNLGPNFKQNLPIFQHFLKVKPILDQIWENFEKLAHSYTRFCIL